jgi:proteasome lid subunit RPN8/RPN11
MRISRADLDVMFAHARTQAPNEACGLLAGDGDTVEVVYCLENARHSPSVYELGEDGYRLLVELEEAGRLLGAFHSHPRSEAYPSPTDRRQAFWPIRYVILSFRDNAAVARVFRIVKSDGADIAEPGVVHEEPLQIL